MVNVTHTKAIYVNDIAFILNPMIFSRIKDQKLCNNNESKMKFNLNYTCIALLLISDNSCLLFAHS